MKTFVEFRSEKFPPYEGEEESINPGLWGKRLAEYLVEELSKRGIECEEIIPEDWGWYVPTKLAKHRLALCCGHQYGDDDQLICFTDPKTPVFRKFFRRIDLTEQFTLLIREIDSILKSDPEIGHIEWIENI